MNTINSAHAATKPVATYASRKAHVRRLGITLVEALAMITIIGTISSLCGMAIHRATMTQKLVMRTIQVNRLLDNLHTQLMRDTHSAVQLSGADGRFALVDNSGNTVEYRLQADAIQRRAKTAGLEWTGTTTWDVDALQFTFAQNAQPAPVVHYRLALRPATSNHTASPLTQEPPSTRNPNAAPIGELTPPAKPPVSDGTTQRLEIQWTARLGGDS